MDALVVQEESGLEYDQAVALTEAYLPPIGRPSREHRQAAETAAKMADDMQRKAISAFLDGDEAASREYQAYSMAFKKVASMAASEAEYAAWRESLAA